MYKWTIYEDTRLSGIGITKNGSYFVSRGKLCNTKLREIKQINRLTELRALPTILRPNALILAVVPDPLFNSRSFTVNHALNILTKKIHRAKKNILLAISKGVSKC